MSKRTRIDPILDDYDTMPSSLDTFAFCFFSRALITFYSLCLGKHK